jgi:hypothetical protein
MSETKYFIFLLLSAARLLSQPYTGQMGVNLVHEDAFVDMVKETNRWQNVTSFDDQGWPESDCSIVLMDKRPVAEWSGEIDDPEVYRIDYSGTYHCSFQGMATVSKSVGNFHLFNQAYDAAANTTTFDLFVTAPGDDHGLVILSFSNTMRTPQSRSNTGITHFKCMRPGYDLDTDQVFTEEYLALCKSANFACYRYYTVQNIWGGEPDYPEVTEWNQRKLPEDASQSSMENMNGKRDGWCWEYIIELANLLKRDIWINIHISCTEDYVRNLAQMLQNKLLPEINIYVENSNEVWSPTHMTHGPYNNEQAREYGISFDQNYARRCVWLSDRFKEVFGEAAINHRIRVICAGQHGWFARSQQHMGYIQSRIGPPKDYLYAMSIALYFGSTNPYGTPAQINQGMIQDINEQITNPSASGYRPVFIDYANSFDLKGGVVIYEGGPGELTQGGSDRRNMANVILANRTAKMKDVMIHNYGPGWLELGGSLACHFTICSDYNRYGCWGLTDDYTDPDRNYKMAALREMIGEYPETEEPVQNDSGKCSSVQFQPNPFYNDTAISYTLEHDSRVTLSIYNIMGKNIKSWPVMNQSAGNYSIPWDGLDSGSRPCASGIYLYLLQVKSEKRTIQCRGKIILVN